jgi:quinol-cytochrome oxidoreductase complex cytochrome b subunit
MQLPYDVLFWMVGQECMQKKKKKKKKKTKTLERKRKREKHTDYHPVSFYVYFIFWLFFVSLA